MVARDKVKTPISPSAEYLPLRTARVDVGEFALVPVRTSHELAPSTQWRAVSTFVDEMMLPVQSELPSMMMATTDGSPVSVVPPRIGCEVDPSVYQLWLAPGAIPAVKSIAPTADAETSGQPEMPAVQIQQRTVMAMLNEAARCLSDGIIRSPRDGDVGAVFGLGFPPFRGGPFRYIDSVGPAQIVERLEELNTRFAGRFEPAQVLFDAATARRRFY